MLIINVIEIATLHATPHDSTYFRGCSKWRKQRIINLVAESKGTVLLLDLFFARSSKNGAAFLVGGSLEAS